MFQYVIVGQLAQAETAQRRIQHRLAAVAAPVALDPDGMFAPLLKKVPMVRAADQAVVPCQLRQAMGPAIAFQIAGCRAQVHDPGRQAGGHQP
ncbi:hypothetical protein D3C72_1343370 [compost metagenome]